MACMCGDLYCGSCGPAQGNGRCGWCGAWALDGGCKDPAACEAATATSIEREEEDARELEQYWREQEDRV